MTRDKKDEKLYAVYRLRRAIKSDAYIEETAEKMLSMGWDEDVVGPLIDKWRESQRIPQQIADIVGVSLATVYRYFSMLDEMEEEKDEQYASQ